MGQSDREGAGVLHSVSPATNDVVATYKKTTPAETGRVVERADRAFESWRRTSFGVRAASMRRAADLLEERKERYASLMALEMGKPLAQGRSEIEKCAWACRFFADHAEEFLAAEPAETSASRSYVAFRPLGVVLGVMPWNFPFWQVVRFAAPALMAGNACVLKHASNVSGCALAIGEMFHDAGFPEGLFGVLLVGSDEVVRVLELPRVRAVALTGSSAAGRSIASHAGRLLKKSVLELGGSDPYVVLEDADLDLAVEVCAAARLVNAGQSCIAAKRFIVVEPVRDEFTERFTERLRRTRMGDPMGEGVEMGPLARRDLRDQLHAQVRESVRRGASLALGGEVPPGPGAYYPPTVLTEVRPGMPAFDEETFGPVAAIVGARTEAAAIQCANESPYGLGAAVFTRDAARGERIASEAFEAGACFVNAQVHSDPRLPFGGVKESGYGRELGSFGIREFVNVKSVYVR
ncbi:MAG TPA: NAD-dependent succinate-semialdehyde dehydrogenase [Candidatus Eisenbacteria bacterium]|nr:NAD-dependent succinate-semialdehyde dehydrogenase [Candidatus Eisenbacteria bacterium]